MPAEETLPDHGAITAFLLPRLILKAWRERFSGALCLEQENQQKQILFHEGSPVQLLSNLERDSLALFLAQTGKISREDALLTRDQARKNGGHEGITIMKLGFMDAPTLFASIQEQLEASLHETFRWRSGQYRLDPENAPGPELTPFRFDPLPTIQRGLEKYGDTEILLQELETHLNRHPRCHLQTRAIWARLQHSQELDPSRWRPELDLNENWAGTTFSLSNVSALWILMASGALSFTDSACSESELESRPPDRAAPERTHAKSSSSTPSSQASTESDVESQALAFQENLAELLELSQKSDYYALLRVDPGCAPNEIRKAYLKAAKLYHPDTTLKYGRTELKEQSSVVFSHITEAFEVLRNPEKRRSYDARLRGEPVEASANQIAQAEIGFQKADVLLRMGQFKDAIPYLEQATELVPDEEEFHAALGWALYKVVPSEPRRARETLERATKLKPDHALAHFRLGIVCRSLGDTKAAEEALATAKTLERGQTNSN